MFNTLKKLYAQGRLTEKQLLNAASKLWITQIQAQEIIGVK